MIFLVCWARFQASQKHNKIIYYCSFTRNTLYTVKNLTYYLSNHYQLMSNKSLLLYTVSSTSIEVVSMCNSDSNWWPSSEFRCLVPMKWNTTMKILKICWNSATRFFCYHVRICSRFINYSIYNLSNSNKIIIFNFNI